MLCIYNIFQVNDSSKNNLTHDSIIILSQLGSLLVTIVIIHSIHPSLLY